MPKQIREANVDTQMEQIPLSRAEEQVYEDFEDYDALYGPDAYLGDQYPATLAGKLITELHPSFQTIVKSDVTDDIRQEVAQQAQEVQSERLEAQEHDAAQASQALSRE